MTTTDLSKFGYRELEILRDTLNAWMDKGLPLSFTANDVHPMMNQDSGYVFLTNDENQVAMLCDGELEVWHSCPECGAAGFHFDLRHDAKDCCNAYLDMVFRT